jgi:hypothetical protein
MVRRSMSATSSMLSGVESVLTLSDDGEVLGSTRLCISISRIISSIAVCLCNGYGYGLSAIGVRFFNRISCSISLVRPTLSLNTTEYLFNTAISLVRNCWSPPISI